MSPEGLVQKDLSVRRCFIYGLLALYSARCTAFGAHLPDSVVYPRIIDARRDDNIKVLHVRSDLIFSLEPASILGDTITMITDHGRIEEVNTDYLRKRLYQDVEKSASLYVEDTDSGILTEGVLGNELRIEPLRGVSARQDGAIPHKIFAIDGSADYSGNIVELDSTDVEPEPEPLLTERSSEEMPKAVYVNISILVDSVLHNGLRKLNRSVLTYVAVFMNGVNLRYAQLKDPRFQVKLRVIENLSVRKELKMNISGAVLNLISRMEAFRKFVARPRFDDSAVVFILSGRDVVGPSGQLAFGVAMAAQLCSRYRFGVAQDIPGTYNGIRTASHEILHIVGVVHDTALPLKKNTGEPGATKCPAGKHIMSPYPSTMSGNEFSECTQEQVTFFLKRTGPPCWEPLDVKDLTPPVLPGSKFSATMFCLLANSTKYTSGKVDGDCRINCTTRNNKSEYFLGLDGMQCPSDPQKVCIKGKCMRKHEIPKTLRRLRS